MVKHRICKKCGGRIKKVHRWHVVHHRFLFLRWETVEHRDCARPEMVHRHVVPLASVEDLVGRLLPRTEYQMPEAELSNEDGVQTEYQTEYQQTYVEGL